MQIRDAVVVVTGGGSGIGAAMCRRFAAEGAAAIVVADRDDASARQVATEVGGIAERLDVTDEASIRVLVARTEERFGRIDLFCSNAGVGLGGGIDAPDEIWQQGFAVHLMAHLYAARAVLPGMLGRGHGWLLNTASAAGLLQSPANAPYTVSKHAAVALAEFLAVEYGGRGIGVSVLCPMGVRTPLLMTPLAEGQAGALAVASSGELLTADEVADAVIAGLAAETFLILPHTEVGTYWAQKAADPDRWLSGLRRLVEQSTKEGEL